MYKNIASKGFKIQKLDDLTPILKMKDIIYKVFQGKENLLNTDKFRKKLLICQDLVNNKKIHLDIVKRNKSFFLRLFDIKNLNALSMQTVVYFRGVRPSMKKYSEFIGYHRENFYNDFEYINKQINIHIPIQGYTRRSAMRYIPNSHKVDDKKLEFYKLNSKKSKINKFSVSHKIGLPYNPKIITGGINFAKSRRCNLKEGQMFVFTSKLLHGGGQNLNKNKTRFSVDFGLILKKDVMKDNKKFHFSSYRKTKEHYYPISSSY